MNWRSTPRLAAAIVLALTLSACKKDDPFIYDVPASIQPYIDSFVAEAQARGVTVDVSSLVVTFEGNLLGNEAAGTCTFATTDAPGHVRLDTTSNNWQNNLSSREQLVFHELGHCLLNRRHREDVLPNGEYVSLMRGAGDQIYGEALWKMKRAYYLDELFNSAQPSPVWATTIPSYAQLTGLSKTPLLIEEFNNNQNQWNVGVSTQVIARIANSAYYFESKVEGNAFYTARTLDIDTTRNFVIETAIRIPTGNAPALIQWGGNTPSDFYYLGFSSDSVVLAGNWSVGADLIRSSSFDPRNYTKVTLWHSGDFYYLYVNEKYVTVFGYEPFFGNKVGFYIGSLSAMEVDYFKVNYLP